LLSNDVFGLADGLAARWVALALTGCPGWSLGTTVTLEPCARLVGGWLRATGLGLTDPNAVTRSWWSAGALLRAIVPVGAGFSLEAEVGVTLPFVERRFITTTPERTVGETPTVSGMLAVGISHRL
jgi:hypothetical protein